MLAVLPSSAVVLGHDDRVLRASSAARAFGLVNGDQLMAVELLALARQVRRDGEIRESEIEVAGHKFGMETTAFAVRVAPARHPWPGARPRRGPDRTPPGRGVRSATSSPTSATS